MTKYRLPEGAQGGVCPLLRNEPALPALHEEHDTEFTTIQPNGWTTQKTRRLIQKTESTQTRFFLLFLVYE